jgi:hypothetical protein
MTKYKTINEDIIDTLKYGNIGYIELVEYVENTYNLHDLFTQFDFGHNDDSIANFDGTINLFPFFNYKLQFTLQELDKKPTRVMFGRYISTFRSLGHFCPNSINYKTITNIKCRDQFVARLSAWHKFVDKTKDVIIENTEIYMKQLDQTVVDDINNYLTKYRFNYTVSLDSLTECHYTMLSNLDDAINEIKAFRNPHSQWEIE